MGTTINNLPLMDSAQTQKYLTFNTAISYLDALTNVTVFNRALTAPPASPSEGDRYIVKGTATGSWTGQENKIAIFIGTNWVFFTPSEGWRAYDQATNEEIIFTGSVWLSKVEGSSGSNGSSHIFHTTEELVVLSGASVSSSFSFPNQCLIYGVSLRVISAVTGASSFDCGDGSDVDRFGASLEISLGSVNQGVIGPSGNYSSTNIVLTANGSNFTGGSVRIAAHYSVLSPPSS